MAVKAKRKRNRKTEGIAVLSAAVLLVIAIAVCFVSRNAETELFQGSDLAMGIDVSSHNGEIDWEAVAQNMDFAFIRVGYRGYGTGEIKADSNAEENLKMADKAGLPVGVYFYSQAVTEQEAREEAEQVLAVIKDYSVELSVVIDFEYAYNNDGEITGRLFEASLTNEEKTAIINAFCQCVSEEGYTPGIYAATSVYETHLNVNDFVSDAVIWVADYNENITYSGEYDIWQYSKHGSCEGVTSKYVDVNYWYLKGEDKT